MNSRKPNWKKWESFYYLQIWQIVALSFDIDPDFTFNNSTNLKFEVS